MRDGPVTYWPYIKTEDLRSLPRGRAEAEPATANDDVMFIVVHQIEELWFKLALREVVAARDRGRRERSAGARRARGLLRLDRGRPQPPAEPLPA